MGLTVRDALVYALENLEKMGFKKFRKQLHEIEVKENYRRIPRGKLEDKDWADVADLIREYYKDVYGVEVTLEVLDKINEKKVAEELLEDLKKVNRFVRLTQLEESKCLAPEARPMKLHLSDTGEMICSVTLETFYPGYLHIEWKCGKEKSGEVSPSLERYTESLDHRSFSVCSEVRISQDSIRSPESKVHVSWEHEYTNTKGQQTFSITDQDFLWRPVVDEIQTPLCIYDDNPVVFSCHISGYYPDDVTVKWFRRNKKTLELCEDSDNVSIPKIRSNRNPDNTYSCRARLTMTPSVENHLRAEYVCQVEHPSLEKAIKKSTGGMKILAKPQLESITKALEDNALVKFTMHLKKFYPKDIKVKWHRGETQPRKGVQQMTLHTETLTEREDSLYDVTSNCGISGCCFGDPQYKIYVTWQHESMDGPETRTLSARGAALEVSAPTTYMATMGPDKLIPCEYTIENPPVDPGFFAAFWFFQGKEILSYDNEVRATDSRYSLDTEKALQGRVDLSISDMSVSDAGVYTCSVLYSPVWKKKDIIVDVKAPPQVTITSKTVNKKSVLRCSVTGFYPAGIEIKWFRGSERLSDVTEDPPSRNLDGTYSVNSTVTITSTEEDQEQNVSCRVQHESLKKPLQEDFQLGYTEIDHNPNTENTVGTRDISSDSNGGITAELKIGDIIVPDLILNNRAKLKCPIYNYKLGEHTVEWYEKKQDAEELIPKSDQRRIQTERQKNNTLIAYLALTPVKREDDKIKYICKVKGSRQTVEASASTKELRVTEQKSILKNKK
ncbi:uncharacterized protein [Dendrobates tinctorius]|uniref:uncharacterized protein isoform X2 n=1 Tax=Dendrobates tinctorius TaxID=92724 RepID=UPI003CCA6306